jgi:hypothetical protein
MLGMLAMVLVPVFGLVFIVLLICLLNQLYLASKEKFRDSTRLYLIIIMLTLLCLIAFRPFGIINYESYESKDVLTASRGGVAGCTFLIKLKENKTFYMRSICFGVDKISGTYTLRRDTIWLAYSTRNNDKYQFALLKPSIISNDRKDLDINLYRSPKDTIPFIMTVRKNELIKNN